MLYAVYAQRAATIEAESQVPDRGMWMVDGFSKAVGMLSAFYFQMLRLGYSSGDKMMCEKKPPRKAR